MSKVQPPFMNAYGLIGKILNKIKSAQAPARFTQDFLASKLGFASGSAKVFIPYAKRIGLIGSDGVPTELYHRFRNPALAGTAAAEALQKGYADLFTRNEYAHELPEDKLRGLVIEATGLEKDSATLRAIVKSFLELRKFADFDAKPAVAANSQDILVRDQLPPIESNGSASPAAVGIGLSYTINLNLPETADIAVFNAIFRSLKENLLRRS